MTWFHFEQEVIDQKYWVADSGTSWKLLANKECEELAKAQKKFLAEKIEINDFQKCAKATLRFFLLPQQRFN